MIRYELIESGLLGLYKSHILPSVYDMLDECEEITDHSFLALGAYDEEDYRPVAACVFDLQMDDVLALISIYVDESHRRQGIGRELISLAFSVMAQDLNVGANTEINAETNTEINVETNTEINAETNTQINAETDTGTNTQTNTFICNYRMAESDIGGFEGFLEAIGVLDYINLPEGAVFSSREIINNPSFKNALFGFYTLPEYTYSLNDMVMEMDLFIRDHTSPEAYGDLSFVATDSESNMYCSVVEKIDEHYFRLFFFSQGEDSDALFRAFEATVSEVFTSEDPDNTLFDITFNDPFSRAFFDSLGIKKYTRMVNNQAAMVVEFLPEQQNAV